MCCVGWLCEGSVQQLLGREKIEMRPSELTTGRQACEGDRRQGAVRVPPATPPVTEIPNDPRHEPEGAMLKSSTQYVQA